MVAMTNIEIIYPTEEVQELMKLVVGDNTTVQQAIVESGILVQFPKLELTKLDVGIYSKKVDLDTVVKNGDRIEIYRPLKIEPKQARRVRAKKKV